MKNIIYKSLIILSSAILLLAILVTSSCTQESSSRNVALYPPDAPSNWTDGYVLTNGIRIHYWRTGGDKPVMIMAHGSSDNGLCWACLAMELEADYDIIMYDARGHGLSDPPTPADSANAQSEDLAGLIRELNIEHPIIMGHSMGSSSVALFAATYPDIPKAVILEDPGLAGRPGAAARPANNVSDKKNSNNPVLEKNNMSYSELYALAMRQHPEWGECENKYWAFSKKQHHPPVASDGDRGARVSTAETFAKITAPTLILKADAQGDLRAQNEEVAANLQNGKIVHIEGAKHNVRRDQKELLLEALKDFLNNL